MKSLIQLPMLILAGLAAVYLVLGVLYESYYHPLTILSTLPSAGVGALLALLVTGDALTIIGFIAILLLIGILIGGFRRLRCGVGAALIWFALNERR